METPAEVAEHPWEMAPRLAHADRIADAHPHRAAAIRAGVAIRELRWKGVDPPGELLAQQHRAHRGRWEGWVAPAERLCDKAILMGGYVERASFTVDRWLENGPLLRSREPILDVILRDTEGRLDEILAGPSLAGLRELSLIDRTLGDAGAVALARHPDLEDLCALDLRASGIGERGLFAIVEHLPRLQKLMFSGNAVDPNPVVAEEGELIHGIWPTETGTRLVERYGRPRWFGRELRSSALRPLPAEAR